MARVPHAYVWGYMTLPLRGATWVAHRHFSSEREVACLIDPSQFIIHRSKTCYAAHVELVPALFLLAVVVGGSVFFGLVFGFIALWLTRDAQHGREIILAAGFLGFGMLPWLTAVVLLYFLMKAVHPFAGMKVAATALFVIPWCSAVIFVARSIMRTRARWE